MRLSWQYTSGANFGNPPSVRAKRSALRRVDRTVAYAGDDKPKDVGSTPTPQTMAWKWRERLGRPTCPYLVRWVADFWFFTIRLHHWVASDDQRNFHDHPWWYITLVIRGGYTDIGPTGTQKLSTGTCRFFPATHQHTVRVNRGGAWTLLITGREKRVWGFWVKGKFRKRNKYFFEFGHHPCETEK